MVPGGVCAHLEYQIEDMTDYVAEMAQRLFDPITPVTPEFRKFVLGLLSSTRLPHTTILLGMNYLAKRLNSLKNLDGSTKSRGNMWRLLTIGLLLGSKFLDDNTFQNKSWAEVSGIAVSELNSIEHAWLEDIKWKLYVDLDNSEAYQAWLANWKDWAADRKKVKAAALERLSGPPAPLAPIDTNVSRPRPYNQIYRGPKSATQERQQYVHYEHPAWANHSYPTPQHTPPSAPDSAVTTPEYLSATGPAPQYDWGLYSQYAKAYNMAAVNTPYVMPDMSTRFQSQWPHHYSPHHYSPHHYSPQHYFHQYSIWNHQPSDSKQAYFMPQNAYGGHQAVVG
ncbi:cyclin-like protein [Ciborinia camelliae]|nr:cyclin-like protein [Ciborinia camelliae]